MARVRVSTVRPLSLFYQLFLIDPAQRKAVQLCPFVNSGIMHHDFQPFLRPDGMGIDYSRLTNYDTFSKMESHFAKQYPRFEKLLRDAIGAKNMAALQEHIPAAEKAQFHRHNPDLLAQAKQLLNTLSTGSGAGRHRLRAK